jgi:membrane-bound lytic murein transglycosylase D
MSPLLRRAVLLALACACAPVAAGEQPVTTTAPASTPLVPLPILAPEPAVQPPVTGTPIAPELTPPAATEVVVEPVPPPEPAAVLPARPMPATISGDELFKRLRARLNPNACDAGSNSARWRARYAGHPTTFARRIEGVLPLLDFVSNEVERAGLPAEFTFIPLVESWYNPGAIGPGGPAGMWQMIASTAKNHGIHIREGYDGRLSPVESTRAALSYLHVLQGMFGDWQAIVMAYNAGEGRMQNALRRAGSRRTNAAERRPHGLSNITYDYVDKLQALSCLVSQPQRFNLHLPVETRYEPLVPILMEPELDTIEQFARARGRDAGELRRLNPGFRGGRVVDGVPRLVLSHPGERVAPTPQAIEVPPVMLASTEVEEGELAVAELLDAALEAGEPEIELAVVSYGGGGSTSPAAAMPEAPSAPQALAEAPSAPIAVAVADVPQPTAVETANAILAEPEPVVHEVRQGESLWSIAQQHHMPVEQLRRANKLDGKATLHAGQVLQLVP